MVSTRNSGAHEGGTDDKQKPVSVGGGGGGGGSSGSSHGRRSQGRPSSPPDASPTTEEGKVSTRNSARRVAFKYEGDEWELGSSPTRPRKTEAPNDISPNHTPIASKTRGQARIPRNATPYQQRNGHAPPSSNNLLSDDDDDDPYFKRGSRSVSRNAQSSSSRDRQPPPPPPPRGRSYGAYEEVDDAGLFSEEDSRDSMTQIVTRHRRRRTESEALEDARREEEENEDRRKRGRGRPARGARRGAKRADDDDVDDSDAEEQAEKATSSTSKRTTTTTTTTATTTKKREPEGKEREETAGIRTRKRVVVSSSEETTQEGINDSSANDSMDVETNSEDAPTPGGGGGGGGGVGGGGGGGSGGGGGGGVKKTSENGVATRRSSRRADHSDDEEEEEPISTRRSSRGRRDVSDDDDDDDDRAPSKRRSLRRRDADDDDDDEPPRRRSLRRSDGGGESSSRPTKRFSDDGYARSTRSSRAGRAFADDEAIEDNTWMSEDNDGKDDDEEEDERGLDMYSRVKERHKARKEALRTKDGSRRSEGDSGEEEEEEEDGDDGEEEEEEEEGEEEEDSNRRVLRTRGRPKGGGGGTGGKSQAEKKSYSFRTKRAPPQFYQEPLAESRPRARSDVGGYAPDTPPKRPPKPTHVSPAYRKTLHRDPMRNRRATHRSSSTSSSSSSSSSPEESSDEKKFQKRKTKSMKAARRRLRPMNFNEEDLTISAVRRDRVRVGTSLADVDPMSVDKSVLFESVGGLSRHIRSLKEMIVFPLLYPEIFDHFKIEPPRGCIFYGPPGTGKTLMARALANECSRDNAKRRVAFFMRKGADCLSKWVGESERQLRLLFDQAYQMRPSIIFFDEIDGLAPVRSSRQDQIHSSIVSTLLALMDGLDARGQVIVIGATNRLDSIDPALRRPGRFDREFLFPLPDAAARRAILAIHTKAWNPPPKDEFVAELADACHGYCGADLKALCTEATLCALRRRYPQIYASTQKLQLDVNDIRLARTDFNLARKKIVPAAHRSAVQYGAKLPAILLPFLGDLLKEAARRINLSFVAVMNRKLTSGSSGALVQSDDSEDEDDDDSSHSNPIYASASTSTSRSFVSPQAASRRLCFNGFATTGAPHPSSSSSFSSSWRRPAFHRPRLLLQGSRGSGLSRLAPALLHQFEKYPVHALDLNAICSSPAPPEEIITIAKREAKRNAPAILYIPSITRIWDALGPVGQAALFNAMDDVAFDGSGSNSPLLLVATSEEELPEELSSLFDPLHAETLLVPETTTASARRQFFYDVVVVLPSLEKPARKKRRLSPEEALAAEPLPVVEDASAAGGLSAALTADELERLEEVEEKTLNELRIFLREVLGRLLRDRRFSIFSRPIDPDTVPDYFEIIKNPMDLSTMMARIDRHEYSTGKSFLADVELICNNALEYNPDETNEDRAIRHRACTLKDVAHAIMSAEFDPEFEKRCAEIIDSRAKRGETPSKTAPAFSRVLPAHMRRRLNPADDAATTSSNNNNNSNSNNNNDNSNDNNDNGEDRPPSRTTEEAGSDLNASRDAYRERKKRKRRCQWARGVVKNAKKQKRRIESDDDDDDDDDEEDEEEEEDEKAGDEGKEEKKEEDGGEGGEKRVEGESSEKSAAESKEDEEKEKKEKEAKGEKESRRQSELEEGEEEEEEAPEKRETRGINSSSGSLVTTTTPPPTKRRGGRRRRLPCGVCDPCQIKTNCRKCTNCKFYEKRRQVCERRKCVRFRTDSPRKEPPPPKKEEAEADVRPVRSPRLAKSSADAEPPVDDAGTPPRVDAVTPPPAEESSSECPTDAVDDASDDAASASFSPMEEDGEEASERKLQGKPQQPQQQQQQKTTIKESIGVINATARVVSPSSKQRESTKNDPSTPPPHAPPPPPHAPPPPPHAPPPPLPANICDNDKTDAASQSKLIKAEDIKGRESEIADIPSSTTTTAASASPVVVDETLREAVVLIDENSSTASGGNPSSSSGIESDLSSSPKVISFDVDDGEEDVVKASRMVATTTTTSKEDVKSSKPNLHKIVSSSIIAPAGVVGTAVVVVEEAASKEGGSPAAAVVSASAAFLQSPPKTPIGSAFNHLIEDALAQTAGRDSNKTIGDSAADDDDDDDGAPVEAMDADVAPVEAMDADVELPSPPPSTSTTFTANSTSATDSAALSSAAATSAAAAATSATDSAALSSAAVTSAAIDVAANATSATDSALSSAADEAASTSTPAAAGKGGTSSSSSKKAEASPVRTRRQLAALSTCPPPPASSTSTSKPAAAAVVDEELPPPSPIIRVEEKRLEDLLQRLVEATKDSNVHALEKIHAALSQVAWRRRRETDRHAMVDEMEAVITALVK